MNTDSSQVNNKKLYVGNLPYGITQEDLQNLFSQYGKIASASIISDRMSGRSKGFGFVEFEADEDDSAINAAIEALHGSELDGRTLVVNIARPREENSDRRPSFRSGGGGGFGGGRRDDRRGGGNDRRGGGGYGGGGSRY